MHRSRGDIAAFEAGIKQLIGGENGRKYAREEVVSRRAATTAKMVADATEAERRVIGETTPTGTVAEPVGNQPAKPVAVSVKKRRVVVKPTETRAPEKTSERRTNIVARKHVDEMSPEEMVAEIKHLRQTSEEKDRLARINILTGLPNKLAYDENPNKLAVQAFVDIDGMKLVNDTISHAAGDELIKALAKALASNSSEVYHRTGDEFYVQADTVEEIEVIMNAALETLSNKGFEYTTPDGQVATKKGIGFSYARGKTIEEADLRLKDDKAERERAGKRVARADTRRVAENTASGRDAESDSDTGRDAREVKKSAFSEAIAIALASNRAQKAMNLPSALAPFQVCPLPLPQPLHAVALHGYAKGRYAIKRLPFAGCWCKGRLKVLWPHAVP